MSALGSGFTVAVGTVRIVGKSPDGDSIRFVPADVEVLRGLQNGDRLRVSGDGSVQLRLDTIDAPETHYKDRRQPFATVARDELVAFAGYRDVVYDGGGIVTSVAEPLERTAMIAAKLVETNGRPVCYLWTNLRAIDPPISWGDGDVVEIHERQIHTSVNAHMIASGRAYTTLYTSTPPRLRAWFTELALKSNVTGQNVWADDHSPMFTAGGHEDIGENGVLILPKLFRRVTDYLVARDKGEANDGFLAWLRTATTHDGFPVDDELDDDGRRIHLSDLISEDEDRIGLNADLHKLLFVEK